jgi:hypothetical protein
VVLILGLAGQPDAVAERLGLVGELLDGAVHQVLDVEGGGDRLADLQLLEMLDLDVEGQVLEREADVDLAGHVGQGLDLGHLVELGLGVDQVDLVVLQGGRLGGRLGQEPEHD